MPIEWLLYPILGLIAGLLAGLLGVGGGLVLVAALAIVLPAQGVPESSAMHAALATSLASVIVTAAASARAHHRRGGVVWPTVAWMAPGLVLGAWLGSWVAVGLAGDVLRWFVVAYCVIAALQLILGQPAAGASGRSPIGWLVALAATGIGAVSSLVGIGGGSMTVPLLIWRGVTPVRAVGTSSACGVAIGLAAAVGYASHVPATSMPDYSWGYVFLPAAIGIALTSVLMAPVGAALAHRFSGRALRWVFAGFLLLMAVSLAL